MIIVKYNEGDKVGLCTFKKELDPIIKEAKEKNSRKRIRRVGLFICHCGNEFIGIIDKVRARKKSCGCSQKLKMEKLAKLATTHGMKKNPLYKRWYEMVKRCKNLNDKNYGGRGIKVCDQWLNVQNFINDMYPTYIKGLDLDRINNNGNYEPSNCRWTTRKINSNNRRNTIHIEHQGINKTISELSLMSGIPHEVLLKRSKTWTPEEMINVPYPCPKNYRKLK